MDIDKDRLHEWVRKSNKLSHFVGLAIKRFVKHKNNSANMNTSSTHVYIQLMFMKETFGI